MVYHTISYFHNIATIVCMGFTPTNITQWQNLQDKITYPRMGMKIDEHGTQMAPFQQENTTWTHDISRSLACLNIGNRDSAINSWGWRKLKHQALRKMVVAIVMTLQYRIHALLVIQQYPPHYMTLPGFPPNHALRYIAHGASGWGEQVRTPK